MVNPVLCSNVSIPIEYDIQVNVTRIGAITGTTLDQIIFCTPESPLAGPLSSGAGRVKFYISLNDVIDAYGTDSESYRAAVPFFAQSPRPPQLGIGQIFETPQPGAMRTGIVGDLVGFQLLSDGAFTISIDSDPQEISTLDFTTDITYDDVAATIETALQLIATGGYTAATVTASAPTGTDVTFTITSGTVGGLSTVSVLTAPTGGTDISTVTYLNGGVPAATLFLGYTPTGIAGELALILEASKCQGRAGYGFVIDNVYADTADQLSAATWAAGNVVLLGIDVFNPLTIDIDNTTNNAVALLNTANKRATGFWSDVQEDLDAVAEYDSMGELALQLSVDWSAQGSYLDVAYKDMPTITPTSVTTGELNILRDRRTNILTTQGNGNRVIKYGFTYNTDWLVGQTVAIDNLVNDTQEGLLTLLKRSKNLPYNAAGQGQINQVLSGVGEKYVRNTTLSDVVVADDTQPSGERTIPAYVVEFAPLSSITPADRAANILRGVTFTVNLAGSIHQIVINVIVDG